MFQTDLLSIIRSLNTVYTATGLCHAQILMVGNITSVYTCTRGDAVGLGTALQAGRSQVQLPVVSLEFFIDIILPAALWPWG